MTDATGDERADAFGAGVNRNLARSNIGLDVAAAMRYLSDVSSQSDEDKSAHEDDDSAQLIKDLVEETDELINVIIETNSRFNGGANAARGLLISFWLSECFDLSMPPFDASPEFLAASISAVKEKAGITSFHLSELLQCLAAIRPSDSNGPAADPMPNPFAKSDEIDLGNSLFTEHYVFAKLKRRTITRLAEIQIDGKSPVYKITGNHLCEATVYESGRTVAADAARRSFENATGKGIVWAVADSGIDRHHPHFRKHNNLGSLPGGVEHMDFTGDDAPHYDPSGHGTHVAGIIAGETALADPENKDRVLTVSRMERDKGDVKDSQEDLSVQTITGVAPMTKLVSLKVVGSNDRTRSDRLIAALGYVRKVNSDGHLMIHGINISLGYMFDPDWYAAGHSPLCKEVDRTVRDGVVVVVAAGNGGYGTVRKHNNRNEVATHLGTISDPGNAERAVTVGSTHRDAPEKYGVSFFSAKGPTADGRMKPDIVAPGERIVSADPIDSISSNEIPFKERSGTSMAAPHVSGCAAAMMSRRTGLKGQPDVVKRVISRNATDLGRQREFQGAGLIDLMRSLQTDSY